MTFRIGKRYGFRDGEIALGTFFVAVLLMSQNVMQIGVSLFNSPQLFRMLLLIGIFYNFVVFGVTFSEEQALVLGFISLVFLGSWLISPNEYVGVYFGYFLEYALAAYLIVQARINERKLYLYAAMIGFVWLLLNLGDFNSLVADSFRFGYLLLQPALAVFMLTMTTDKRSPVRYVWMLLLVTLCVLMIVFASRGPVASLAIVFGLYYLKNKKLNLTKISIIIAAILLIMNYREILMLLAKLYPGKFSFIEKTLLLEQMGSASNGRDMIMQNIFRDYSWIDFLFGAGVGHYASQHNGGYTHNILTSILLEAGLISLVYLLSKCWSAVKKTLSGQNNFLLYLMAGGIIPLLFSDLFWRSYPFWLFIFWSAKERYPIVSERD